MEDLRRAIAFIFKREGARALSRKEITLIATMDLHWFSPSDAERLVDSALRGGVLVEKGGKLEIAIDPSGVKMPVDFRPGRAALDAGAGDEVVVKVAEQLSRLKGLDRSEVVRRINALARSGNIEPEAAALLVASEEEMDGASIAPPARAAVLERAKRR